MKKNVVFVGIPRYPCNGPHDRCERASPVHSGRVSAKIEQQLHNLGRFLRTGECGLSGAHDPGRWRERKRSGRGQETTTRQHGRSAQRVLRTSRIIACG
eukprot:1050926-Pleurochrysis_carterae.AAC.2